VTWQLTSHRPLPGSTRVADGYVVRWDRAAVMGIINVTPDSFSDGGRNHSADVALEHARSMVDAGALIVDVGGESTRPGARPVSVDAELDRVIPIVRKLAAAGDVIVSVDTRRAEVAAATISAGAHLINDVSALGDPQMLEVCATTGTPMVLMHMLGTPETMQDDPRYDDVVGEVGDFLCERAERALLGGVPSVMVDPGIGFGKLIEHNLALLDDLPNVGDVPIVVGASRKRFLGELTGLTDPAQRDTASIAVHLHSVRRGAAVIRAHDVAGHVQALAVQAALGLD
jgi:dihydropteroate synthase